jgi:histidinol-phosphate/aromatic aminotransferase/cobyric acid decarboxylase-like protein
VTLPQALTRAVPPAGRHGGDGRAVARALGLDPAAVLDLSASLNPVAPSVTRLLHRHLDAVERYPDPARATAALADAMGVEVERLLLTNGGAEAIALVASELGGHVVEPEFSLYPRHGGPRWRSNPHNPSGRLAGAEERGGVWDEAFYPLATGCWTRGDGVVVGSLTKLFACPGLRLGYVLAEPPLVASVRSRQPQWSVNALAVAVVPELVEDVDLPGWAAAVAERRAELSSLLAAHGLDPAPSAANFVLCRRALGLRERLAPLGVVVRDCASFGLAGQARVAVPDWPGLEHLARALEQSAP